MPAKNNRLGFQEKIRTQQEIDQDYNFHCANIGHKLQTIHELEQQIEEHRKNVSHLKDESRRSQAMNQARAKTATEPSPAPEAQAGAP